MTPNQEFGRRAYPPQERRDDPPPAETVGRPWKWAITAAIAVVLLLATYSVTTHRDDQLAANPPAGSVPAGDPTRPGG